MQTESSEFQTDSTIRSAAHPTANHLPRFVWSKAATYLSLILLGGGVGIAGNQLIDHYFSASVSPVASIDVPNPAPVATASGSSKSDINFATHVVQQVGPAVVRIDATHTVNAPQSAIFKDPFFQQFLGSDPAPSREVVRGIGSGFIINSDGEILTNAHVVDGVKTVTVTLKDGRSLQGQVLGSDPVTDIAVVKVAANHLPTVALGNSEQIQPGEWAVAIGNPLGLDNTVTTGIVSATGRSSSSVGFPNERVNFIQTDAAINPGNSGGPLLNASGQVIGINTAIIQDAQGIGFAVPINQAKAIAKQLVAEGSVQHSYLGIQMISLSPQVKQDLNSDPNSGLTVDKTEGVLVAKVMGNSPAAKAGIRAGDVITQIAGQTVQTADQVQQVVEQREVGSQIQLRVERNGKTLPISVQLGQLTRRMAESQ